MPNWNGSSEYTRQLAGCITLTAQLAERSPMRMALARAEIFKRGWNLPNVEEVLTRHIAELDAADRAREDAQHAAEARDWADEQQMYRELRMG